MSDQLGSRGDRPESMTALQQESSEYARLGKERFTALIDSGDVLDDRDIRKLIQMIAMEYIIAKHREEIKKNAIGQPSIVLPEEIYFAEHFARRFDDEFSERNGELSEIKAKIFSKRNATKAIEKIEELMDRWWQEELQKQIS